MSSMMFVGGDQGMIPAEIDAFPKEGQVFVRLLAAAFNKRDYWITQGKYPGVKLPLVLGSDGAGMMDNREVIINPSIGWGDDPDYFADGFKILGLPDMGTFSDRVIVQEENIYDKPAHLSWVEAAALPVCGVTAYRAMMTRGRAKKGERMLITGIGGGVATMALLFGVAMEMEVWVTSSSDDKIQKAKEHGAMGGVNYKAEGWDKELVSKAGGRFDLIIDGAGGKGFAKMVHHMNPRGRIVIYGGTAGNIDDLSPQRIFWKQLDIMGSTMGSPVDFQNMLDFVVKHKIKPIISHVFNLYDANEAMALMASGDQFGKVCLDIPW